MRRATHEYKTGKAVLCAKCGDYQSKPTECIVEDSSLSYLIRQLVWKQASSFQCRVYLRPIQSKSLTTLED